MNIDYIETNEVYDLTNFFRNSSAYVQHIKKLPKNNYSFKSKSSGNNVFIQLPFDTIDGSVTVRIREHSDDFIMLLEKASWTRTFFEEASKLDDVRSILPYYKKINQIIAEGDFELCDTFLSQVRVDELSDTLLVGLLRLTNSWKNELPSWHLLLESAKKEISQRFNNDNENEVSLEGLA